MVLVHGGLFSESCQGYLPVRKANFQFSEMGIQSLQISGISRADPRTGKELVATTADFKKNGNISVF